MTLSEGLAVCLGLLLTPGPTNTLLALAAATAGRRAALALMPAEVAGYLVTVIPLLLFGQELLEGAPVLRQGLQIVAGLWVAFLAVGLWRGGELRAAAQEVSRRRVFVTTVLNPKALLFGLFVFPPVAAPLAAVLAGFVACILVAASGWVLLGTAAGRVAEPQVRRAAAVVLTALSVLLLQSGVAAAF